ncbi:MAG: hypothetical protein ACLFTA_00825 [Candidatus Nanohaloarchaea archaeon]
MNPGDDEYTKEDNELVTPEEDVGVFDPRKAIPDRVPIPEEQIDDEEPSPESYDEVASYVNDLLEYEIGFSPEQAAEDPANPGQIADQETVLSGQILDVTADETGVQIFYINKDHLLEEADYPIEEPEDMPDVWANVSSSVSVEYNPENFPQLRQETKRIAKYINEVDEALSNQKNP